MAKKEMIATQRAEIYGFIIGGEVKEFTSKEKGTPYKSYEIKLKEKTTGFTFKCKKLRNLEKTESDGQRDFLDSVEKLAIQASSLVDGKEIMASLKIYPTKDKKGNLTQWNWVTTDVSEDGRLFPTINTTPKVLVDKKDIDEHEAKESYLTVSMIVDDIDRTTCQLKFTDGNEEYEPKVLYASMPEEFEQYIDNFEIGSGYECRIGFKKGNKIAVEEGSFSFGEEGSVSYEPNKFLVLGTSYLENLKLDNGSSPTDVF